MVLLAAPDDLDVQVPTAKCHLSETNKFSQNKGGGGQLDGIVVITSSSPCATPHVPLKPLELLC